MKEFARNEELEKFDTDLPEVLDYLDELRDSGVTNMFGARPYIQDEFGVPQDLASDLLAYWMKTFGERHETT